ncbi:hypothetical protein [Flindersiella endophytica]
MLGTRAEAIPREQLKDSGLFLFSWLGLLVVSVIVSGRILAGVLRLPRRTQKDKLRPDSFLGIRLPGLIRLQARGDEVVFGFVALILVLSALGLLSGPAAYAMFVTRFGVDPGQFPALCVLSSFASVVLSTLLWTLVEIGGQVLHRTDPIVDEHREVVQELVRRAEAVQPAGDPATEQADDPAREQEGTAR